MVSDAQPIGSPLAGRLHRPSIGRWIVILTGITFLSVLVILPLASIFQYAASQGVAGFWSTISSPEAVYSLQLTVGIAIVTTGINVVFGTMVAFMLVRQEFRFRNAIDAIIDLPIAIPASVTGFTLLLLYGPLGWLGGGFEDAGIRLMFAIPGIVIAHVFMTLPYVVRGVAPLLQDVDRSEEEAARTMGANGFQILRRVIMPAIAPGLASGAIFTFARSLGEFGATIMVSGNLALRTQTAPLFIFSEFNKGNIAAASSMAVVLILLSFVLFFGFKLTIRLLERKSQDARSRSLD